MKHNENLLTGKQVEEYTNGVLSDDMLRNWRCNGTHRNELPHVKVSRRVYYKPSVVDKFLESCASGKQQLSNQNTSSSSQKDVGTVKRVMRGEK